MIVIKFRLGSWLCTLLHVLILSSGEKTSFSWFMRLLKFRTGGTNGVWWVAAPLVFVKFTLVCPTKIYDTVVYVQQYILIPCQFPSYEAKCGSLMQTWDFLKVLPYLWPYGSSIEVSKNMITIGQSSLTKGLQSYRSWESALSGYQTQTACLAY